jgi:hypothetical protein
MLLPGVVAAAASKEEPAQKSTITYIADRDLVRFGKFAVSILAIFVVVGTYLFGIKLEVTVEKMRTAQRELEKSQKDLEAQRIKSAGVERRLEGAEKTAEGLLQQMEQIRQTSITMEADLEVRLSTVQQSQLQRVKATSPEKFRGEGNRTKTNLWANGTTLHVRFLEGTSDQIGRFKEALGEWLQYANLHVSYDNAPDSEIRVSFSGNLGSWSYVGTDALGVSKDMPTIEIGNDGAGPDFHVVYLAETGHLMGLVRETSNPKATLKWNRPRVHRILEGPPNYWTKEEVDKMFAPQPYPGSRPFDPNSIMMTGIPAEFFVNRTPVEMPTTLSDSDKKYISALYPR